MNKTIDRDPVGLFLLVENADQTIAQLWSELEENKGDHHRYVRTFDYYSFMLKERNALFEQALLVFRECEDENVLRQAMDILENRLGIGSTVH